LISIGICGFISGFEKKPKQNLTYMQKSALVVTSKSTPSTIYSLFVPTTFLIRHLQICLKINNNSQPVLPTTLSARPTKKFPPGMKNKIRPHTYTQKAY
jgi:hypothetical protein